MQRWFFLGEHKRPKYNRPKKEPEIKVEPMAEIPSQEWLFTVSVSNVEPNNKVFITGNTPELGAWDSRNIVILENIEGTALWSKTLKIPNTCVVLYRYGKICVDEETKNTVIRQWETHVEPRAIKESMLHPITDIYGEYGGRTSVSTGWLTTQTLLQFKFVNNPIKLKAHLSGRPLFIKVTPVNLTFENEPQVDNSTAAEATDTVIPPGVLVEVSTFDSDPSLCVLSPQKQFGRGYRQDDVMIVNMTMPNYKVLAYLVDFYSYSSYSSPDGPPYHVGYTYIIPSMFKASEGALVLPVTCSVKHRPLGTISIEYLIMQPMPENLNKFEVSYAKYWDQQWRGLEVGHRGSGASFKIKGAAIRENTIASFKSAASHGADMLEFDVQLSKDLIPIIYHDFHVCISIKKKKEVPFSEMLELPVKDLTLEHLQKLKVYHLVEGREHKTIFNDEELEENQPFPTLEHALKSIDEHVGFNVELKWTMELNDGTFELDNPFDMNTFVDKILEVVLLHAGNRRIIFSCFNPDVCTMVRNKQNKYPVMFLTVGITSKYPRYRDPRCTSIPMAVQHAVSSDILGIVAHTEDLLRDPTQMQIVTDAGLVIFCWGDDNNSKQTIKKLKNMGLHAVIYDKFDQYTTKKEKESIYLMEHHELQQQTLDEQMCENSSLSVYSTLNMPESPASVVYLDLLNVRKHLQNISTSTSLASLVCASDLRDEM